VTKPEKYSAIRSADGCVPTSYRVDVACETEECAARVAAALARVGATVYRKGLIVYGFGEGAPPALDI